MFDFIITNYVIVVIAAGMILLGLASALLGVFNNLRNQALIGDGLSHAALPGVVLSYMLTNNRNMIVLLIGAAVGSVIAILLMNLIKKYSKVKNDASLALVLASFFGFGQIFLLIVQYRGDSTAAGLNNFIFGQAATMLLPEVITIGIIALIIIFLVLLFYKELKLFLFNEEHFASLGFSVKVINFILTLMTVLVVIIGIRTVGVILMSALLIAPGVAARQWSNKLSFNLIIAGIIGMSGGLIGALISYTRAHLPTGPVVVLVLSVLVFISLLFAPRHGIIKNQIVFYRHRRKIKVYSFLIHLYNHQYIKYENNGNNNKNINDNYINYEQFSNYININKVENKVSLNEKGYKLVNSIIKRRHD